METVNRRVERVRDGDSIRPRPQQRLGAARSVGDSSAGRDAAFECDPVSQLDAVPDRARSNAGSQAQAGFSDHAVADLPIFDAAGRQNSACRVKSPAAGRKRPSARQRFERRAEKIAGSAEVAKRPAMSEDADFLAALEHRLPQVGDEGSFARRDAREEPPRQDRDAGVQERLPDFSPETRDQIPFGLQRRVPVGLAVLGDQKSGLRSGGPVGRGQGGDVDLDCGVAIEEEKVLLAQPACGVSQGSGRPEDWLLVKEREIRKIRAAVTQAALDLTAQMVEIDACFAHALLEEPSQVRPGQGHVQKREERLGHSLGHRPKPQPASGREEEGLHEDRKT